MLSIYVVAAILGQADAGVDFSKLSSRNKAELILHYNNKRDEWDHYDEKFKTYMLTVNKIKHKNGGYILNFCSDNVFKFNSEPMCNKIAKSIFLATKKRKSK